MYSCPCGKIRPIRNGANRRALVAHAGKLETRNARSRERRVCEPRRTGFRAGGCGRRREPRASWQVNSGEAVRRPGVLFREAGGEVFAVSNDAVDERDDDEEIADDERDCALCIRISALFQRSASRGKGTGTRTRGCTYLHFCCDP